MPSAPVLLSRRQFAAAVFAASCAGLRAAAPAEDPCRLDFQVELDGFGGDSAADIKAVLKSAAETLWSHCPKTRFEEPGFRIYHRADVPITDFMHTPEGRVSIGLATAGTLWAQMAFQFAHEFCHALAGHTNDWRRLCRYQGANMWFEESLCETASLFALRAMGAGWQTAPPYPNWRDYAPHLTSYARDRLAEPAHQLPAATAFPAWMGEHEAEMRKNPVLRDRNCIVAAQLLPLFEAEPSAWEAVTALNLARRDDQKPLARHLSEWRGLVPAGQRPFIGKIQALFGLAG
jgi:hypothetical protein